MKWDYGSLCVRTFEFSKAKILMANQLVWLYMALNHCWHNLAIKLELKKSPPAILVSLVCSTVLPHTLP